MQQAMSLGVILVIALAINVRRAAIAASDGNWGAAIGTLIGPLIVFYVVHTAVYFVTRLLRGRQAVAGYASSRLNYISCGVAVLAVLAALAGPA